MNILMNCLSAVSGGAVAIIRNLAPLLSQRFIESSEGHKLTFLAHESQKELFASVPNTQLIWVSGARLTGWRRIVWERRNIDRILGQIDSDLLFTPYQVGPRVKGIKQVFMLTNMEPYLFYNYVYDKKTRLRNHMLRKASNRSLCTADRVIAVSEFTRNYLNDVLRVPSDCIHMVFHGRNTELSASGSNARDRQLLESYGISDNFILTCGSLLPYRRCEDVIAAYDRCAGSLPHGMQLVIAGSGADKRYGELIRRAIAASACREQILLLGHVLWDTMKALYRQCDLCALATEIEACPNIAIEAMTAGCVIVSADKPPLPEIFQDASIFYEARNIAHLAEQMQLGLKDDRLRDDMRSKAKKRAESFSWAKCAGETYNALTDWS